MLLNLKWHICTIIWMRQEFVCVRHSISKLEPITGPKSEMSIPRNIDGSRIGKTIRRLENNMAFIKKVPSLIKLNKKVKVKHSKSIGFYLKLCKRNAMKEKNTPLKAPTLQSKLDYPAFPNIVITVSGLASLISFFMNNYYYDPQ